MEKYSQKRSKSSIRGKTPQSVQSTLSLDQILKHINPQNKSSIELEDMKRLLHRVPESSRSSLQQIFHTYIFSSKSFSLPVSEFCRLFDQLQKLNLKNYEESHFRVNPNITRDYSRGGAVNKDTSFYTDNRSVSPERKGKSNTYVQLYKDKKTIPVKRPENSARYEKNQNSIRTERTDKTEKLVKDRESNPNIEKRFVQYNDTKETADMSPLQKSIEVFNTNRSFKDCYSNLQELIDIRKAHLKQMGLGNK